MKILALLMFFGLAFVAFAPAPIHVNFGKYKGESGPPTATGLPPKNASGVSNFRKPILTPTESDLDCSEFSGVNLKTVLNQVLCEQDLCGAQSEKLWASLVNRMGRVCQIYFSGPTVTDARAYGRESSAAKAFTALSFSHDYYALSSGNLYSASRYGGIYSGQQKLDTTARRAGDLRFFESFGQNCGLSEQMRDPLCGQRPGGIVPVGGGLALYKLDINITTGHGHHRLIGAVGVGGGINSCSEHNFAWQIRHSLGFDYVPNGPNTETDNLFFENGAWIHPNCGQQIALASLRLVESHPLSLVPPNLIIV